MKLNAIQEQLGLRLLTADLGPEVEVTGAYTSDLLSDVIANSKESQLWITLQTHQNIVAVAKLKDLAGIIVINNREPEEETLRKANEEGINVFQTSESAFVISGRLYRALNPEG
jgi:hypothetical protein